MVVLEDDYRGEQFPRVEDNSPLTVYMNVTLLAFPKIDVLKLVFSGNWSLFLFLPPEGPKLTEKTIFSRKYPNVSVC